MDDFESDCLAPLKECLVAISNGKITERKKQIEKLKHFLTRSDILHGLDQNSAQKRNKTFDFQSYMTWSKVFSAVTRYIEQEVAKFYEKESSSERPSDLVLSNRKRDKKFCADFFKYIVKILKSRNQYGVFPKVVDHLLQVMKSAFTRDAFGMDYTNILLKEMLTLPHFCLDIGSDALEYLLDLYCKFIENPPLGWDKTVLAQVVYQILEAAYQLFDVKSKPLLEFFTRVFTTMKCDKANRYHEFLMQSLMLVCQNVGSSSQMQLCFLGEEIILSLINIWKTKPVDSFKELIMEFLLLQLALHHPKGATDVESGAFACNWPQWKKLLISLYHLIIKELDSVCERNKYTSSKDGNLQPNFVAAAVEVCAQVFQDCGSNIEVTQLQGTYEPTNVVKKRRVEIGFRVFLDSLQSHSSSQILVWLQLLYSLLAKYPKIACLEEIEKIINILIDMHLSCNQMEVKTWLLSSCEAAVQAFCILKENAPATEISSVNCQWSRLWELGLKSVSLMHQCHKTGHKLLTALLQHKLVTPKNDFFKLYTAGSNNKVSEASLISLSVYLENFGEPIKNHHFDSSPQQTDRDWFRNHLMNWIFQTQLENCDDLMLLPLDDCIAIQILSAIVSGLCLQNYEDIIKSEIVKCYAAKSNSASWITNLEHELLCYSFNVPVIESKHSTKETSSKDVLVTCNLSISIWKRTAEIFANICDKLIQDIHESDNMSISKCVKFVFFIFNVMKTLHLYGAMSKDELFNSSISHQLKMLLHTSLEVIRSKERYFDHPSLSDILPLLLCMTNCDQNNTDVNQWLISIVSEDLCNILLHIIDTDIQEKQKPISNISFISTARETNGNGASTSSASKYAPIASVSAMKRKNRYDTSRIVEQQEISTFEEFGETEIDDNTDAIDEEKASKFFKLQLECTEVLYSLCKLVSEGLALVSIATLITEKLVEVIEAKRNNLKRNESVHLVLKVTKALLSIKDLSQEHIACVLSTLKFYLNKYSKCRSICVEIISVFHDIYPHVFGVCKEQMSTEREHMLHLLSVLWAKECDDRLNKDVSYSLISAVGKLLQFDDNIQWIDHKHHQNDNAADSPSHIPVMKNFSSMFQSKNLHVRLFVASQFKMIIKHYSEWGQQVQWFEEACEKSNHLISDMDSVDMESQDLQNSLLVSLLHFLIHAFLECPPFQKRILFSMCELVKKRIATSSVIIKVINEINCKVRFETPFNLLEHYLAYILDEWIIKKHDVKDFPVVLLGFDNFHSFLKSNYITLVPFYFYLNDLQSIRFVAELLGKSLKDIVQDCLPQILGRIFSWHCINQQVDRAKKCHQLLEKTVTKEVVTNFMKEHIDDIVIYLLNILEDSSESYDSFSDESMATQGINHKVFLETTEQLKVQLTWKKTFVSFLFLKRDSLQNILLFINTRLSNAKMVSEKCQAVLMYTLFMELLFSELTKGIKHYHFFIHLEIVQSLVNFFVKECEQDENTRFVTCIDLVKKLCDISMPKYKENIGNLLPFIVSRLIPCTSASIVGSKVLSLLIYLIVDCSCELEKYIVCLDPFPDNQCFQVLKQKHHSLMYKDGPYSLEMEMEHFIQSYKTTGSATIEGVKYLCVQLKTKKEEILSMLNDLQEKNILYEDYKSRKLHSLIWILVSICTTDNADKEVQIEASRCLGEVGPINLSTMVLQTSQDIEQDNKYSDSSLIFCGAYCNILKMLYESYVRETRMSLKVVTSRVLKELFKLKETQDFLHFAEEKDEVWLQYLYPFQSDTKTKKNAHISTVVREDSINHSNLWTPEFCEYSQWVKKLVCTILESGVTKNEFFHKLLPVCQEEAIFCGKILPYLIHSIILQNNSSLSDIVSEHISTFFMKVSKALDTGVTKMSFYTSKASVQTMLSVVNYLRLRIKPGNVFNNCSTGLKLNYLHIAEAAQHCSAHFSAILYTELWCDSVREGSTCYPSVEMSDAVTCSPDSSPMSVLNTQDQDQIALVYKIRLNAYSDIGDSDGIYGCIEIATDCQSVIHNHYMVERKWDKLLNLYDASQHVPGVMKALNNCGLEHTLQNYLGSQIMRQDEISSEMIEYQCEIAWRMSQWDVSIPEIKDPGFNQECFKSLQCLYNQNDPSFLKHMDSSRNIVFQDLSHTSLESVSSILLALTRFQMLRLVEEYSSTTFREQNLDSFQEKWQKQKQLPYADFEFFDPISWLHCMLLKQRWNLERGNKFVAKELKECFEQHAIHARENCYLEASTRCFADLRSSSLGNSDDLLRWQMEEAKVLWKKKEQSAANRMLKSALYSMEKGLKTNPNNSELMLTYAKTLSLRGKLLEETCGESSAVILNNYLQKSISVLEGLEKLEQKKFETCEADRAILAIARFADRQYQSIIRYKNSTAHQTKQELMKNANEDIAKIRAEKVTGEGQKKTLCILIRQHKIDEGELKDMEKDQQEFLMKALSGYLACLRTTSTHDLWVFRLTALWFQNLANDTVNDTIKDGFDGMETYKFLPLMYQLAARMGTESHPKFTQILTKVIKTISLDHPHHSLPIIFSMSNADKDPSDSKASSAKSSKSTRKERTTAATHLLAELQSTRLGPLLRDMSLLCEAYITLAYMSSNDAFQAKQKVAQIPLNEKIMRLKNLKNVPVITEVTKVDRTCKYDNIIGIHSFQPEFRLCGGINVPKVIKCIGMDGVKREQLVKGKDDLRQDAVMQQVFHLVNCLLKQQKETGKRRLQIRTYKVVPMSRRSGVLQWCTGTQPISQYLVGPDPQGGAHKKYYPQFWQQGQCMKNMKSIADYSTLAKKREIYDNICKNFPPVFRYFFLENFPEPSAWFERQQSYTKSVATSSIVGYILGLGDRHVNNILIDKCTAEFVHIDFGIAFESGRILQTPETVPFRMTRDVVDGMGFIGTEGLFKRCCEKTLEVMRESQDVLLTILEVLLYDPLYDWTIPSGKSALSAPHIRYDGQSSAESASRIEVNKLAERALMRLQQKLQGLEEGMTLSVSGQVNLLIQQARDPNNLCKIYAGWQPYL